MIHAMNVFHKTQLVFISTYFFGNTFYEPHGFHQVNSGSKKSKKNAKQSKTKQQKLQQRQTIKATHTTQKNTHTKVKHMKNTHAQKERNNKQSSA